VALCELTVDLLLSDIGYPGNLHVFWDVNCPCWTEWLRDRCVQHMFSEDTSSQNSVLLHKLRHRDFAVLLSYVDVVALQDCEANPPICWWSCTTDFLTLVSSLAAVPSDSYLFVISLANAACVFAFNPELTKETLNCFPL